MIYSFPFMRGRASLFLRILAAATCLAALTGCYSFSGSTLPPHLRTLRIHPVENRTLDPTLPDRITRGLQDGFRARSNLRQVNQSADAELYGTVLQYSHLPQSTSGAEVAVWRVDIVFRAVFIDRVRGDTMYSDNAIPGYGQYSPGRGETEETGRARAIEALTQVVLDHTVLAW